jgi:carboxyl-terminal processing protease
MRKNLFLVAALLGLGFTACKKKDSTPTPTPTPTPTASKVDLLKDSVYLFSKEVYLWNDVIPAYNVFNPRGYSGTTDLAAASAVMNGIRALQPLDHFSFVTTKEQSSGLQTGVSGDYGFWVKAATPDGTNVYWYVNYVYKTSSAGTAGIERGYYISKVNGAAIGYNQAGADALNAAFASNTASATFEFTKPDGSKVTATLNKGSYNANAVLYRNVINTSNSKKVGYLVFNQFFGAPARAELAEAFTYFQSQGIDELVVDLRNNPGGSTETQDTLANLIAPIAANNGKMYTYFFNQQLQNGIFPLLKTKPGFSNVSFAQNINTVNFKKAGSLNLPRVFIIATSSSASASELLINNLKPYMDVKLIGDTTYGKPVGFFPIDVYEYSLYPISFKTVNSAGNADYYNGFYPDKVAADGVNKNWGDVTEPSLASALKYITTGAFKVSAEADALQTKMFKVQQDAQPLQRKLEASKFNGMFSEKRWVH